MDKEVDRKVVSSQWYHNKVMQEIDEAFWIGDNETGEFLEQHAKEIQQEYLDKGNTWYPLF